MLIDSPILNILKALKPALSVVSSAEKMNRHDKRFYVVYFLFIYLFFFFCFQRTYFLSEFALQLH